MATYRFEAARQSGAVEKGEIDADGPRSARSQLRARGLVPISLALQGEVERAAGGNSRYRMREAELALVTRQLASLMNAGLQLDVALATLIQQAEDGAQREIFQTVRADVLAGHRFAAALERHPRVFPRVYCATVAAGEQAGSFGLVLDRLAQYLEDRQALRGKLLSAATYPAIVTVIALAIVVFLMTYVVPQVVEVFEQTRQSLPLPTRILLGVSAMLSDYWIWFLICGAVVVYAVVRLLQQAGPKAALDQVVVRLPVIGRIFRGIDTARFASTLAMLSEAGVPMLRALSAAEATLSNSLLRAAASDAIDRVREGVGLARALATTGAFPPVLIRLIEVGESTGDLPKMLAHAAHIQAREVERRVSALATLAEPLLILIMGGVVLGIVLAVLLPIIEINQLVR
ncbi:MAG: type II secretion system inner membrane protein GspF [Betaproteobacteria bacterium]|nr:MAG: type II secretion system inner membrane protein GspF [Betaproteobacteria bacterium]